MKPCGKPKAKVLSGRERKQHLNAQLLPTELQTKQHDGMYEERGGEVTHVRKQRGHEDKHALYVQQAAAALLQRKI